MMINKIFIDLLSDIKKIAESKSFHIFKSIKIYRTIQKSYKLMLNTLKNIEVLIPTHIADYVAFLSLANSSNCYNKDLLSEDVNIAYEFDMNDSKNQYTHFEGTCTSNSGVSYTYAYTSIISNDNEDEWYISTKCFKTVKGVGITGDTVGEYENTSMIFEGKKTKSIKIISIEDAMEALKYPTEIEKARAMMGSVFINFASIGISMVYTALIDNVFKNKKNKKEE